MPDTLPLRISPSTDSKIKCFNSKYLTYANPAVTAVTNESFYEDRAQAQNLHTYTPRNQPMSSNQRKPFNSSTREQIKRELNRQPKVCAAFLLGSAARGRLRQNSDIDLALLPMPQARLSFQERGQMAAAISSLTGRETDIGVLQTNNLIYAKEAFLNGKRIFCRDCYYCDLFIANTLGLYLELRQERRGIENAYRA